MTRSRMAGVGRRIFLGTLTAFALLSGQSGPALVGAQPVPCEELVLDFSGLPKGTLLGEQYAGEGIHISAIANEGRPNQLIVFDSNRTDTRDPEMEVGIGNLAIIPEHISDPNNDGLVDDPNNSERGGRQIYTFDHARTVRSFVIVDIDHGVQASQQATAFDAAGNVIVQVPIPIGADGNVQTVQMNASGVRRLEIRYRDSAGVTDIDLGCAEEQPPQANLIVIKNVINDNGGTATAGQFTMSVADVGTDPPDFPGAPSPGTTVPIDPGAYAVTETGPAGYTPSFSPDCTGSIAAGETKTCTVTNDDIVAPGGPGKITVVKNTVPDSGQDFAFTAVGPGLANFSLDDDADPALGNTRVFEGLQGNTVYTITEVQAAGWGQSVSCNNTDQDTSVSGRVATIDLDPGEEIVCTFTNTSLAGAITLDKTVNPGVIHAGQSVTYTYRVTNTGNEVLHAVSVTDDKCAPVSGPTGDNGNGVLDLGETWTYTCTTALSVDTTNVATVTALDSTNDSVGPVTDTASVDVLNPALSISKTSDVDSGSPGDTVTFSFTVTNTGDAPLFNISVDDDVLGHIGDITSLAPGQSVTLTKEATLGDENLVNVGSVVGGDIIGLNVRSEDKHEVDVVLGGEIAGAAGGDEVQAGVLAATGLGVVRMLLLALFLLALGGVLASGGRAGKRSPAG